MSKVLIPGALLSSNSPVCARCERPITIMQQLANSPTGVVHAACACPRCQALIERFEAAVMVERREGADGGADDGHKAVRELIHERCR